MKWRYYFVLLSLLSWESLDDHIIMMMMIDPFFSHSYRTSISSSERDSLVIGEEINRCQKSHTPSTPKHSHDALSFSQHHEKNNLFQTQWYEITEIKVISMNYIGNWLRHSMNKSLPKYVTVLNECSCSDHCGVFAAALTSVCSQPESDGCSNYWQKKIHIVAVNEVKGKILREEMDKSGAVGFGAQYLDVSISVTHAEMASKNKASSSSFLFFHHPFLFGRC